MSEQTIMLEEGIPLRLKYEMSEETGSLKLSILYSNEEKNIINLHNFTYPFNLSKNDRKHRINSDIQKVIEAI